MMLGRYNSKLDQKNRCSVPTKFRAFYETDGNKSAVSMVIADNIPCIQCYTEKGYEVKEQEERTKYDPDYVDVEAVMAMFFDLSVSSNMDSQGRMSIELYLLEEAGITDEILFVGKREYFEIWNPAVYEEYKARSREEINKGLRVKATEKEAKRAEKLSIANSIIKNSGEEA